MKKKNRTAFTLIELLVVVATITVLMGILIPTLSRARERARLTVCSSNLRQIYLCAEMYATENAEKFPDYLTIGLYGVRVAPGMTTSDSTLPEVYGLAAVLDGLNKENGNGVDERIGPSYLSGRSRVWICPSHRPDVRALGNTYQVYLDPTISDGAGMNYSISEMKMSIRNSFPSGVGTAWISCGLQFKPYKSGKPNYIKLSNGVIIPIKDVGVYPNYMDEKGMLAWRYPHINNSKNSMNILNLTGAVYLNTSNGQNMSNDIR